MKKLTYLVLLIHFLVFSQPPQGISHRGTAYKTDGTLVTSHLIKIQVDILDGSASGTLVYRETFNPMTNAQGQYSVNIGTGAAISGTFAGINWAIGDKYLKVSIDPLNSATPDYTVVGSNQLMSVPYALFAQSSASSASTASCRYVNTMNELRDIPGTSAGDMIYLKSYHDMGDGGEGYFVWRTEDILKGTGLYSNDNGGTVIKVNGNDEGRWTRLYEGYINVRYFGAAGYDGVYTKQIQHAIDFAALNFRTQSPPFKGTTVYFPGGGYKTDLIVLKNGVALLGDYKTTFINATVPGDKEEYTTGALFIIDKGAVQTSVMNFQVRGQASKNADKPCFYLKAQFNTADQEEDLQPAAQHGGLWNSTFKNIEITDFRRNGIDLIGSELPLPPTPRPLTDNDAYLLPNQFLIFENVRVTRGFGDSFCLNVRGTLGQATFLNCQFDGSKADPNDETSARTLNENVHLERLGETTSCVVSFINSTFQDANVGIALNWVTNVTIDNCWFESLGIAIMVDGSFKPCKSINIVNNLFTNAAGFGSIAVKGEGNIEKGHIINIKNSNVNVLNNYVTVSDPNIERAANDLFIYADNATEGGVLVQGNSFNHAAIVNLGVTSGITVSRSQSSGKISCQNNKVVYVSPSTTVINTIDSQLNASETILIIAHGGKITLGNSGNIFLSNKTSLILYDGDSALFTKVDGYTGLDPLTNYHLTAIVRSTTP